MAKEKTMKKPAFEPRKLKPLNNLGDYIRNTPGLSKIVEKVDKYNSSKRRAKKKTTQDTMVRGNDQGKTNR